MASNAAQTSFKIREDFFGIWPKRQLRQALFFPILIAAAMVLVGWIAGRRAGMSGLDLVFPYIGGSSQSTLLCVLIYVFFRFAQLARTRADKPIQIVARDLLYRAPLLLLPTIIYPVFSAGFTTAKAAIPSIMGFPWDSTWARADVMIFGDDAWRIAHNLLGERIAPTFDLFYGYGWMLLLILFNVNIAIYAEPRRVGIIYTAVLATWFVGGWFLAYAFASAGPVFAQLSDPDLGTRFAPLRDALFVAGQESGVKKVHDYLLANMGAPVVTSAGGISAMPSLHVGMATIYVLAALRTKWLVPATCFWIAIFMGSAYFGYHYWIDGIVATGVACLCWQVAHFLHRDRAGSEGWRTVVVRS
jgi:hypothetical protein